MKTTLRLSALGYLLALICLSGGTGCVGPDSQNTSARPWNEPRGFDTGLFGGDPRRGRYR